MSTWFTILARVAEVDRISNSAYRNALCEFEEGDNDATAGDWRSFYIAFYGDLLEAGRAYMIRGQARLPGNDEAEAPKAKLTCTPRFVDATRTFEFEAKVTGYYGDPVPQALRNDKVFKASQTRTKTQYFYAESSPKFDRTLGSTNLRAQSKLFIDGFYTFPDEETQQPGYLDLLAVSFNSTNKDPGSSTPSAAKGGSSRRRDVPLKGSPATPTNKSKAPVPMTPPSSRLPFYSESSESTPHSVSDTFTPRGGSSVSSLAMGDSSRGNRFADFELPKSEPETQDGHSTVVYLTPGGLQNKHQATEPPPEPPSKRNRKPSQKAKETFINDELEE
ncbi:hypothetical protein MAA_11685 [Metarhizium robertsii ARSEF 23]|uniref:Uncharacterized protein n=2 Tax=Metarhizium TaxID=5529 RepID=A0A0B2XGQ2_METRA|nr:uncharacterized protein MAA_11685 [Metarhizium robertsii ARSEF 23]KHO10727.1 hypothetical protein MAA_11685 [Metarhizium robertsii ARSEF 23]KID83910.1 hypothetical protein MGU_08882 [Metarhizium guizhouense ARSEF 977]